MLGNMAFFSTGIIEKAKSNYDYIENILKCSAVSTYGIWKSQQIKETNPWIFIQQTQIFLRSS